MSSIVVILLMVLLILMAISAIWIFIYSLIYDYSENAELNYEILTLDLEISNIIQTPNLFSFDVKKTQGDRTIDGLVIILSDISKSDEFEVDIALSDFNIKHVDINLESSSLGDIIGIKVYPILMGASGKKFIGSVKIEKTKTDDGGFWVDGTGGSGGGGDSGSEGEGDNEGNEVDEPVYLETGECFDGEDNDNDGLIDFEDFGCFGPNGQETNTNYGWTLFDETNAAKIIFVSSSGNDGNDCSYTSIELNAMEGDYSSLKACKTINKGYELVEDGAGDWLLLKRGDEWVGQHFKREGNQGWSDKSGKSRDAVQLISSYGNELSRPKLVKGTFSNSQGHQVDPAIADQYRQDYLAIKGIEFYRADKDPKSSYFTAAEGGVISRSNPGEYFLIEDVYANYGGIVATSGGNGFKDFRLRRSIISDSYSNGQGHAQGLFLSKIEGITLEQNIFDTNGWNGEFDYVLRPSMDMGIWREVDDGRVTLIVNDEYVSFNNLDFRGVNNLEDISNILQGEFDSNLGSGKVSVKTYNNEIITLTGDFGTHPKVIDISKLQSYIKGSTKTDGQYTQWIPGTLKVPITDLNEFKKSSRALFGITYEIINVKTHRPEVSDVDFTNAVDMGEVAQIMESEINNWMSENENIENAISIIWDGDELFLEGTIEQGTRIRLISNILFYPDLNEVGTELEFASYLNEPRAFTPDSNQFNHNVYMTSYNEAHSPNAEIIIEGNIISRGSASGIQFRPGGYAENNLFVKNAENHYGRGADKVEDFDTDEYYSGVNGTFVNNVVIDPEYIGGSFSNSGAGIEFSRIDTLVAENNIIANSKLSNSNGIQIGGNIFGTQNLLIKNNIIYNYGKISFCCSEFSFPEGSVKFQNNIIQDQRLDGSGDKVIDIGREPYTHNLEFSSNIYWTSLKERLWFKTIEDTEMSIDEWKTGVESDAESSQVQFKDPQRSVESYYTSIGGNGDYNRFIDEAKKQSRFNWREEYFAVTINDYIREGFQVI
ncbi:hypothetical protein KAR91_63255 [Candidatus Pacearchaeota archaeon]|nr:hypothetical protein [Candidatus Pacearchaeota archaeon]